MSVELTSEAGLPGKPRVLFERSFSSSSTDSGIWGHIWAVFPDGKRFLFVGGPLSGKSANSESCSTGSKN